jgi:Probable cobalt transporter subunit (CbtB)
LWLVTFEGGPVAHAIGQAGTFFHELFHDGRHLIGVPCH